MSSALLPERPATVLPQSARAIALLLASTPSVVDAPPRVLHMLMEFAHRYTAQVLSDAQVFAEHAGRPGRIIMEDVTLAIQGKVGFEFGGRVPKEYILAMAAATNEEPLPPVQEAFGIRLPPPEHCLVQPDFELIPNEPPEEDALYEEIEEEVTDEEEEGMREGSDDEEDVEMQQDDAGMNGIKRETGMEVDEDREGSDLFDGEDEEAANKESRRPVKEDDDYD
ncbi:Transcription initiation factor TFIID subunit 9 [Serendipita sp. 399]|nr:Transcription initiation factor TFIID subunit 9 [Serendipita sp. 399]